METQEAVTRILNERAPGALIETTRFGRSESSVHWISEEKLVEAARALRDGAGFDWLENLSAMQLDEDLVLTYFLRSTGSNQTLILRTSAALGAGSGPGGVDDSWVKMSSVSGVWTMALPREAEIAALFGVKFSGAASAAPETGSLAAGEVWRGFPLRKSFEGRLPGGVSP